VKITCQYRGKEWTDKKVRVSTLVPIIWYVLLVIYQGKYCACRRMPVLLYWLHLSNHISHSLKTASNIWVLDTTCYQICTRKEQMLIRNPQNWTLTCLTIDQTSSMDNEENPRTHSIHPPTLSLHAWLNVYTNFIQTYMTDWLHIPLLSLQIRETMYLHKHSTHIEYLECGT